MAVAQKTLEQTGWEVVGGASSSCCLGGRDLLGRGLRAGPGSSTAEPRPEGCPADGELVFLAHVDRSRSTGASEL